MLVKYMIILQSSNLPLDLKVTKSLITKSEAQTRVCHLTPSCIMSSTSYFMVRFHDYHSKYFLNGFQASLFIATRPRNAVINHHVMFIIEVCTGVSLEGNSGDCLLGQTIKLLVLNITLHPITWPRADVAMVMP